MKCEDCNSEVEGNVCKNCGLVIDDSPIAQNDDSYPQRRSDSTTLTSIDFYSWEHPLSPKTRKAGRDFIPRYQKKYVDYVYIKAYESICKLCASLGLNDTVRYEALNLFKGIRKQDPNFFRTNKLAPTYLACIKIACKIHDYPISNHELAEVIDYKLSKDQKNMAYMERKFNRAYRNILKVYSLIIPEPEHPRFIDYVCDRLDLPYHFAFNVHKKYTKYRKYFQSHFRIEGYILALIYVFGKEFKITLKTLEEKFHISSLTTSNRKNELLKILEGENND